MFLILLFFYDLSKILEISVLQALHIFLVFCNYFILWFKMLSLLLFFFRFCHLYYYCVCFFSSLPFLLLWNYIGKELNDSRASLYLYRMLHLFFKGVWCTPYFSYIYVLVHQVTCCLHLTEEDMHVWVRHWKTNLQTWALV